MNIQIVTLQTKTDGVVYAIRRQQEKQGYIIYYHACNNCANWYLDHVDDVTTLAFSLEINKAQASGQLDTMIAQALRELA